MCGAGFAHQCCRAGGAEIILLSRSQNEIFRVWLLGSGYEIIFFYKFFTTVNCSQCGRCQDEKN